METKTFRMNDKGKQNWLWSAIGFIILNFMVKSLAPDMKGLSISLILLGIFMIINGILLVKYEGFKFLNFTQNLPRQKAMNYMFFYLILGIIFIVVGVLILV